MIKVSSWLKLKAKTASIASLLYLCDWIPTFHKLGERFGLFGSVQERVK